MANEQTNILELPEGCLTHALSFLSPQDLASAAQACRYFAELTSSSVVWLKRLKEDMDLPLQAPHCRRDWRAEYRRLASLDEEPLRFLGSFTDGGCDDELNQYWVDHLFTHNHWEAYCSKEGNANINCLGLLLDKGEEVERLSIAHRTFLIRRLKYPLQVLSGLGGVNGPDGTNIDRYSTEDLEHLLYDVLYHELQQNTMLGQLLLASAEQGTSPETARAELDSVMAAIRKKRRAPLKGQSYLPDLPIHLLERGLPAAIHDHTSKHGPTLALVEKLVISRAGAFSCPVACGVVLLGKIDMTSLDSLPPDELQQNLQEVVEQEASSAFDNATSLEHLLQSSRAGAVHSRPPGMTDHGRVPTISRHIESATGEIAEFQPRSHFPQRASPCMSLPVGHLEGQSPSSSRTASAVTLKDPRDSSKGPAPCPSQDATLGVSDAPSASHASQSSPSGTQPSTSASNPAASLATVIEGLDSAGHRDFITAGPAASPVQPLGAAEEAMTGRGSKQAACQLQPVAWFRFRSKAENAEYRREIARKACEEAMRNGWSGESVQEPANAGPGTQDAEDVAGPQADAAAEQDQHLLAHRLPSPQNTMRVELQDARAANVICIKLITHENRMEEWHDNHSSANIDMNHVQCLGRLVKMPLEVQLRPSC